MSVSNDAEPEAASSVKMLKLKSMNLKSPIFKEFAATCLQTLGLNDATVCKQASMLLCEVKKFSFFGNSFWKLKEQTSIKC